MKRLLLSQNENNNGDNYLVLNGEVLPKSPDNLQYIQLFSDTKKYKEIFRDDFLTIKEKNNAILFSSHYLDKDNMGRQIFYMYHLDEKDNLEQILQLLMLDSKKINRTIDFEKTLQIVKKIEENNILKRKLNKYISIALLILILCTSIAYFISK